MVTRSGITIDEFLRMPETKPASELIWGEVVQKPITKRSHWRTAQALVAALERYTATGVLRSAHLPGLELDLDDLYRRVNR